MLSTNNIVLVSKNFAIWFLKSRQKYALFKTTCFLLVWYWLTSIHLIFRLLVVLRFCLQRIGICKSKLYVLRYHMERLVSMHSSRKCNSSMSAQDRFKSYTEAKAWRTDIGELRVCFSHSIAEWWQVDIFPAAIFNKSLLQWRLYSRPWHYQYHLRSLLLIWV